MCHSGEDGRLRLDTRDNYRFDQIASYIIIKKESSFYWTPFFDHWQ